MHRLCLILYCVAIGFGVASSQVSRNVSLFGRLAPNPFRYSGGWFYVAADGHEYGLLGGYNGTHVIAIDDSTNIHEVGFVSGPQSNWREITVVGSHAFVVTEGGGSTAGMQVISLAFLPDSVHLVITYRTTFTTGHIIMRDVYSDSPYVYVSGASVTGGVHVLNVANPAAPVQVGVYDPPYYIHDAHIRGNRLYASAGTMRAVDIVDLTDKGNPTRIGRVQYQGSYTHSCWTSDDHKFLFVADEQDGQVARIWNIENLGNIYEVAQYTANLQSLVHNPYIRGSYAFVAHNTEGMRVVDIADPAVPVEVGYYDTFSGPSGGFNGLWSACPYLPSGRIIGGDRAGGLYVWKFNNTRAGRVYGNVKDSLSGAAIDSAQVTIVETGRTTRSKNGGAYKIGELAGSYSLRVSAAGYNAKTIDNVVLNGVDSVVLNVRLRPIANGVEELASRVAHFALNQNYPNPFNPITRISFVIPADKEKAGSFTTLKVFDVLGRELATLVNEQLMPGSYEVTFDAGNSSSGIFFYRLQAGGFTATKRMLLLR